MMSEGPFFSIGITTYNRHDLLRNCLDSVLSQTYTNYEVIVGNDYTQEILSPDMFGINDTRIRFLNYPQNIGERRNLNTLLHSASGKYFTWQFDDDFYAADFLEKIFSALVRFDFPLCVSSSYEILYQAKERFPPSAIGTNSPDNMILFSGRDFLHGYLSGKLKASGQCCVYNSEYLRQLGGNEEICNSPFALYSEYLLLVHTGLLEKVAYINSPLFYYRAHSESWGSTTLDLDLLRQAGMNLTQKSAQIFNNPCLRNDFNWFLSAILRLVFQKFAERCSIVRGTSGFREMLRFMTALNNTVESTCHPDLPAVDRLGMRKAILWGTIPYLEGKFKRLAPDFLLEFAYMIYSIFRKYNLDTSIP